jgi:uncharacterized membrane-anchored protein YjiN (DUF445 family)
MALASPVEALAAPPRRRRRLALGVLLGAAAVALAALPVRHTWWGGWILAIAEAGVVGGLADWFAVTAIFRRPLGLPIPHTGLIPRNWERLAERVGAMVGGRVLTPAYVTREIETLDLADLVARGAERINSEQIHAAALALARWAGGHLTPEAAAEALGRLRRLLADRPVAPALAAALEIAHQHGWDGRIVAGLARALGDALDRPNFRAAVAGVVDELLERYRAQLAGYPRLWLRLAGLLGLVDRERLVEALHAGLRAVAADPEHPLRARVVEAVAELPGRLRADPALAARVEAATRELLEAPVVGQLLDDAAAALAAALARDLGRDRPETVAWLVDRLERARRALSADAALRDDLDRWLKRRLVELVERHHGRVARFIENGVRALGPEGAVRLIEEHAGDDLQFIRVNGTLVGGLAGGAIYGLHLLLRLA